MHTVGLGDGVGEGEGEGAGEVEEEEEEEVVEEEWLTLPLEDTLTPRPTARPVSEHNISNELGQPETITAVHKQDHSICQCILAKWQCIVRWHSTIKQTAIFCKLCVYKTALHDQTL